MRNGHSQAEPSIAKSSFWFGAVADSIEATSVIKELELGYEMSDKIGREGGSGIGFWWLWLRTG